MGQKQSRMAVLSAIVVLVASACSPAATTAPTTAPVATGAAPTAAATAGAQPTAAAAAPALPAVPTGYAELDQALGSDKPFNGKTVNIQTQWVGGEGEGFAAAVADFAKATGITFQIDSIASSHETILRTRIEGGSPPDLAVLAQPTAVVAYGDEGKLIDLAPFMNPKLTADHAATIGALTEGAKIWGIPYKADVKSTIWYPIKAFAAAGYTVPTTFDELTALADKIVAAGGHPFCASAGGPGTATGWQLTDWVEQVVLDTQPLSYYNDWISHKVTFEDPGIKAAFGKVAQLLFTPNYVDGGGQAIVNTDQKTPMDPMFNGDTATPGCWMQKIPTWYGPDFFPDQRTSGQPSKYIIGQDIGIFPFPTIDPQYKGAEGSGDTLLMLKDRPEVRAVAEFLATPEGIENWITDTAAGGAISANQTTPSAWYAGNYKLKVAADIVSNASQLGFDASDLMPASVGAGTFWTEMVDWANNNGTNTDAVLKAIDDSWPAQ